MYKRKRSTYWRTKPIRWQTDKKESWRLEFRDKILAGTKAKRLKSDSLRVNEKLAVSQQQRKPHNKYSCFSAISTSTERENKQRLQT